MRHREPLAWPRGPSGSAHSRKSRTLVTLRRWRARLRGWFRVAGGTAGTLGAAPGSRSLADPGAGRPVASPVIADRLGRHGQRGEVDLGGHRLLQGALRAPVERLLG